MKTIQNKIAEIVNPDRIAQLLDGQKEQSFLFGTFRYALEMLAERTEFDDETVLNILQTAHFITKQTNYQHNCPFVSSLLKDISELMTSYGKTPYGESD